MDGGIAVEQAIVDSIGKNCREGSAHETQRVLGEGQTGPRADLLLGYLTTLGRVLDVQLRRNDPWPPQPGVN